MVKRNIEDVVAGWVAQVPIVLGISRRDLAWNFFDLLGTLHTRDQIEKRLDEVFTSGLHGRVTNTDDVFRAGTTEQDPEFFTPFYDIGNQWWWLRIPNDGPVADSFGDPRAPRRS